MVSLMWESVNVSWKVAAEKAGSVFAYFWHKNNFRLKFCGSFKWKKIWECEINFWKKQKFCMQNVMKERKQPLVVIL